MKRINRYYDAAKAHHTPEGFRNPEPSQRQEGDLQRWQDERKRQGCPGRRSRATRNLPNAGGNPPISAAAMTASGGWGMHPCCCGWVAAIS